MSKLLDGVKSKVFSLNGVNADAVMEAEKKLGLHFSEEFRNYLMEYGAASFGSHEFMGLGGDAYLDVVGETLRERNNNEKFPKNCYIVENLGIDGIFILQDEEGKVFEWSDAGVKLIYHSLEEYVRGK
jgi:hypothetical protein